MIAPVLEVAGRVDDRAPGRADAEYTLEPHGGVTLMAPAGLTDGTARVVTWKGHVAVVVNHLQTQGAGDQLASYSAAVFEW
jgi:hypothetical protein